MTILKTLVGCAALASLTACGEPGPSVPFAAGQTMEVARSAVDTCSVFAPRGGEKRVRTMYITNMVLFGIIPGAIGTAVAEPGIRERGSAAGVDNCLETKGFERRNLKKDEVAAINAADEKTRAKLLDHFVMGGELETFSGT
jgi:hypothetical protein